MNNVLYAVRKSHDLNDKELAKRLGIEVDDYRKLESGEVRVNIELAKMLGEMFDIDPKLFLDDDSKIVNYSSGVNTHGNMILHPKQYIDVHTGVPQELFEKVLKERDALKRKIEK